MEIDLGAYHRSWIKCCQQKNAYYEVFWLMQLVLDINWASLHQTVFYPAEKIEVLEDKLVRYQAGEPLAYLLGTVTFFEREFYIEPGVLIPRAATEDLVTVLAQYIKDGDRIIELGVGSGAIICTLAKLFPQSELTGIDQSHIACQLAKKNADHMGVGRIDILEQSWHDHLPKKFQVCFSNPPYIDENDPRVEASVRDFEPKSAWCSDNEGYKDPKDVIQIAAQILQPGGFFMLEHGYTQQDHLAAFSDSIGFEIIQMVQDQQGLPRGILMQWQLTE
ncbi:peptide chain release factor N(5)-glutamine methyltransferase [Gammaproteobacteria bacterium]|nr:peptide chain release factor N(5)-glutamine methyltransferase [Gammaproteobacteria bacterium]